MSTLKSLFSQVIRAASLLGADAQWVKSETPPEFKTVEPGGAGEEMLLLHGLFGALSNWDTLIPHLQQFASPIALSFPLLSAPRNDVKIPALTVFTEFFLRSRGLGPINVCGNSLGGHVAIRLALSSPELVDCLILSGSSGLYEHSVDALPVRPDERFVRDHMGRVFFHEKFITDDAVQEITSIVQDKTKLLNLIAAARSAKRDNLENVLGQIKAPTLLLWGEDDQVTTMDVAETFHKLIPNSELVTIKNCGHAPMIEHPEWFAENVKRFVAKHSRVAKTA